jgi:hypothetical protein
MTGSQSLDIAGVCLFLAASLFGAGEMVPLHGAHAVSAWTPWILKGLSAMAAFGALCYLVYGLALGTDVTPGGEQR